MPKIGNVTGKRTGRWKGKSYTGNIETLKPLSHGRGNSLLIIQTWGVSKVLALFYHSFIRKCNTKVNRKWKEEDKVLPNNGFINF